VAYQSFIDRLIGQSGIVIQTVPGLGVGAGVVKVAGQVWSAETEWPESLPPDTTIMVVGRLGLVLSVLPERG
jgi:membrane protein implicated in regulation of membrane protease activity